MKLGCTLRPINRGVPTTSTIPYMFSALAEIKKKMDFGRLDVCSQQEYHRRRGRGEAR